MKQIIPFLIILLFFISCQSNTGSNTTETHREIDSVAVAFSASYDSGISKYIAEEYIESIPDFQKAIGLDSFNFMTYHYLGIAHYKIKNYDKSITVFDKLIELDPKNFMGYVSRGEIHRDMGNLNKAEQNIQKALKLEESDGYLYATIAMIHADKDNMDSFYVNMEEAITHSTAYPLKDKLPEKKTLQKYKNEERFLKLLERSED